MEETSLPNHDDTRLICKLAKDHRSSHRNSLYSSRIGNGHALLHKHWLVTSTGVKWMSSIPLRILLIEDNPGDARLMEQMLVGVADDSVRLEWVDRLETGFQRLATEQIDGLLLDLSLPGGHGIETFASIKAKVPDLPIIILSSFEQEELAVNAVRKGAQDYLVKGQVNGHLLVRSLRYAIERKRLQKQMETQMHHLSILREINLSVNSTLDLQSVLNVLLEKIALLLPIPTATTIRLFDKETGELKPVACQHLSGEEWKLAVGQGRGRRSETVFKNRAPLVISNVQTDSRTRDPEFFRKHGVTSYLGVPLIAKGEALGVLSFFTKEEHLFSDDEVRLLSMLAGQLAMSIHNAQLSEQSKKQMTENTKLLRESEQRARELSTLNTFINAVSGSLDLEQILEKALGAILDVTGMDVGYIRMLEGNPPKLKLKVHRGISPGYVEMLRRGPRAGRSEQVLSAKRSTVYENIPSDHTRDVRPEILAEGFKTIAWVRIVLKNKAVGIINVGTRGNQTLNPNQVSLLESIGAFLGVALEKADLYWESQRREEIQRLLKELSQDITSLDINSLLEKLTEEVSKFVKVDLVDVRILAGESWQVKGLSGINPDAIPPHFIPGGRSEWIVKNRRALMIPDITQAKEIAGGKTLKGLGVRGYLGLPLFSRKGEAIGVLRALSYQPREFTQEEMDILQQFANGAAIATENARLYEETRRQAIELQQDIAQRKLGESQLKQVNADLKKSHEELKAAQLQLIMAAKLESVGRLAAGVAHEVKNPLEIILMSVEYLTKHLTGRDEQTEMLLDDIEYAVRRADSVVRGLLDFSASDEICTDIEEFNPIIDASLSLVKYQLDRNHIALVKKLGDHLPLVNLDRNKIQQVFVNIFMNAVHAMSGGGILIVKTYTKRLAEMVKTASRNPADHFRIGETVVIVEVEDTGTGIPKNLLSKIFDPFFTTKPTGKGTGLGLTVTNKIVELHGGVIEIKNREQGGARVTVMLKEHRRQEL